MSRCAKCGCEKESPFDGKTVIHDEARCGSLAAPSGSAIVPSHKCRVCGALWRVNLSRDTAEAETWQLASVMSGKCCDNAAMGEQLVTASLADIKHWLSPNAPSSVTRPTEDSK